MWTVLVAIQYISIVIVIISILYILQKAPSKLQTILLVVFFSVLINFVGYLMELNADTKELALQAVKFNYLGKPYIILGSFLFVMEYFKVRFPRVIKYALMIFHIGITFLVFTCTHHSLFYTTIDFVDEGIFPHLVLGHGVFYFLFYLFVAVYLFILLWVGIRQFRMAKGKKEKRQVFYINLIPVVCSLSLIIFLSGITGGYDVTIPAYLFAAVMLMLLMTKYQLLDALEIARENVVDEFASGLFVFDEEESLVYMNPQAANIYMPVAAGENVDFLPELISYSQSGEPLFKDDKVYQVYGKEINRDDIIYGYMYVVDDVTENHNYMINLEKQAQIAKQANQAKSNFLARMSHEIRTPINSIIGMNEMIIREAKDENILEYATDVKSSASALLSIINDILDSSKIESGKMEILPVNFELDSLIHDVVNMMYVKVKEKNLDLTVMVDPTLPNGLFGDDVRIRQILINLLNNGVKYTREGCVSLKVSGTRIDSKERLTFEVSDTGIGIKQEDMPKLFESFKRIEESRNRNIEGTGLGMSIVIDLLKLMGSEIHVESQYGKGSTFSFELLLDIVNNQEIGDYEARYREMSKVNDYRPMFVAPDAKVLVVDDNAPNRKVFCNLLKYTKMNITSAGSGTECLDYVCKQHFDIIFLDHMMPDMDGVETLQRMKSLTENLCQNSPVIALTANAVTGAKEQYLKDGFTDFLSKPIIPEKLEMMIQKYLPKEYLLTDTSFNTPDENSELPVLDGFNWQVALLHLRNTDILKQMLTDIAHSMNKTIELLETLKSQIDDEDMLNRYRTEVHAIKSNMATVGALHVSELAKQLEEAAIKKNIDEICRLHPVFMEEMLRCKECMRIFNTDNANKSFEPEKILNLVTSLNKSLSSEDYDAADRFMEQLQEYIYDFEIGELMQKLSDQILDLDTENALISTENIIQLLQ